MSVCYRRPGSPECENYITQITDMIECFFLANIDWPCLISPND